MALLFYYAKRFEEAEHVPAGLVSQPTLNSKSAVLHAAGPGDSVWVITWDVDCYKLVEQFVVLKQEHNPPTHEFGPYGLKPDLEKSRAFTTSNRPCIDTILKSLDNPPAERASSFQGNAHVRTLQDHEAAKFDEFMRTQVSSTVPFGTHRL